MYLLYVLLTQAHCSNKEWLDQEFSKEQFIAQRLKDKNICNLQALRAGVLPCYTCTFLNIDRCMRTKVVCAILVHPRAMSKVPC